MGLEGLIVAARAAHPKLMGDAKEPVTSLFGPTVKGVRVVLERVVDVGEVRRVELYVQNRSDDLYDFSDVVSHCSLFSETMRRWGVSSCAPRRAGAGKPDAPWFPAMAPRAGLGSAATHRSHEEEDIHVCARPARTQVERVAGECAAKDGRRGERHGHVRRKAAEAHENLQEGGSLQGAAGCWAAGGGEVVAWGTLQAQESALLRRQQAQQLQL